MPLHPSPVAGRAEALADFALRTRSPRARRELEELASDRGADPAWPAALARVVALGPGPEGSREGLDLLDRLVGSVGLRALPRASATLWAQLLLREGREQQLAQVVDDPALNLHAQQRWALRSDLANPHRTGPDGRPTPWAARLAQAPGGLAAAEPAWLQRLNEVHLAAGLEAVRLLPPEVGGTAYRRLSAPTTAAVDGDLVTVVMSTYRPDGDLLVAARGVLEQTWRHLELLVVDDASPAGSEELLEQVAGLDPRVRVVRAERNGGTYAVRNLALRLARGRWMTFQDSDDWTHPRRLEHQVTPLLDGPALATRTRAVRAFPDLSLTYVGYPPARLNASSLMFEIAPVRSLVGGFDDVRKSGDLELPLRLEAVRPGSCVDLRDPWPLAITQLRPDSLSRSDSVPGWSRWDRLAYRDQLTGWHNQVRAGRSDPRLPREPRPFPVPTPAWAADRTEGPPRRWQVVVLADLREESATAAPALGAARTAAAAGLRTALVHAEGPDPLATRREGVAAAVSAAVREGGVGRTGLEEGDEVDLLVVLDPAAVLHVASLGLRVARVVVVEGPGAAPASGEVAEALVRLTGHQPLPARRLPVVAGPVPELPRRRALPRPGAAGGTAGPALHGPGAPGRAAVIGHHLPDRRERWPQDAETLRLAFPVLPQCGPGQPEVRLLSGTRTVREVLDVPLPPVNWLSLEGTGTPVREFLAQLDVWVYQGRWDATAEVAALEAIEAGLPCLLPAEASGVELGPRARAVAAREVPAAVTARTDLAGMDLDGEALTDLAGTDLDGAALTDVAGPGLLEEQSAGPPRATVAEARRRAWVAALRTWLAEDPSPDHVPRPG